MKKTSLVLFCAVGMLAGQVAQAASITIGGIAPSGVNSFNFDDLSVAGLPPSQTTASTTSPTRNMGVSGTFDSQVAAVSLGGQYAKPVASTGNFLTSGNTTSPGGTITLDLLGDATYLGLLWGSVDTYNTLEFFDSSHNLLGSVTGGQVISTYGVTPGAQTAAGEAYVNVASDTPFRYVKLTSSQYAFEIDNVAHNAPEGGATCALLGMGLLGVGALRRKLNRA